MTYHIYIYLYDTSYKSEPQSSLFLCITDHSAYSNFPVISLQKKSYPIQFILSIKNHCWNRSPFFGFVSFLFYLTLPLDAADFATLDITFVFGKYLSNIFLSLHLLHNISKVRNDIVNLAVPVASQCSNIRLPFSIMFSVLHKLKDNYLISAV